MNLPIMLNFQKRAFRLRVSEKVPNENLIKRTKSERLSWECPKKQDNSKFYKKIKSRLCIAKNRVWAPAEILLTDKKWRMYITGYQICKIKIRCFLRISTALKREHHFVKKSPSSGADLRSRLLKWVHWCNGVSTRAPKSTKKLKNCYEFTDYVKISKTSVSIESVRKGAQWEFH